VIATASPRRGPIARVLLDDPLRKLLALALGLLVWLYLNSQIISFAPLSLQLVPRPMEAGKALPVAQLLRVRLPQDEFRVLGYDDAATGTPIDGVEVATSGSLAVIGQLQAEKELTVEPSQEELKEMQGAFVFTLDRVQPKDVTLRPGLRRMQPRAVRVRVDRLETRRIRILPTMLAKPNDPERRVAFDRIDLNEARFYPEEITFRGSRGHLDRLVEATKHDQKLLEFEINVVPQTSGTDWRTRLRVDPRTTEGLELQDPEIQVSFPLRPHFSTFEFDVPVLLDSLGIDTEATAPRLVVEPPVVKVVLSVSGQLEAELTQKSADELRQWAKKTARLLAPIPAGRLPDSPATVLPSLILYDPAYREGRDYTMRSPPPVVISIKR
jgi:hypothetical protein